MFASYFRKSLWYCRITVIFRSDFYKVRRLYSCTIVSAGFKMKSLFRTINLWKHYYLKACKMWFHRSKLRIPQKFSEWPIQKMKILETIKKRKIGYFGQLFSWGKKNESLKLIIQGKTHELKRSWKERKCRSWRICANGVESNLWKT